MSHYELQNSTERGLRATVTAYVTGRGYNGQFERPDPNGLVKLTADEYRFLCATVRGFGAESPDWRGPATGDVAFKAIRLQEVLNNLDAARANRDKHVFEHAAVATSGGRCACGNTLDYCSARAGQRAAAGKPGHCPEALDTAFGRSQIAQVRALSDPGHEQPFAHRYGTLAE